MLFMARRRVFSALTFGSKAGCVFGGGPTFKFSHAPLFSFFYLSPSNLVTPILSHTQLLSLFLSIFQTLIHTQCISLILTYAISLLHKCTHKLLFTQCLSLLSISTMSHATYTSSLSLSLPYSHTVSLMPPT